MNSKPVVEEKKAEVQTDASILRQFATGEVRSHNFEKRDLTKGGDAGLVPESFFDQIIAKLDESAAVRQFATVVPTGGGEDIKFPQITALSSASLVAEGWSNRRIRPYISISHTRRFQICVSSSS